MESTLSIIASICGILGFLISLYAANTAIKVKKMVNNTDSNKSNIKVKDSDVGGDVVGRDKIG